ncbi:MAG: hypothetical protein Kow0010_02530 [Dehalococcoidia bacterium]
MERNRKRQRSVPARDRGFAAEPVDAMAQKVLALFDVAGFGPDGRLEALAAAFVTEALRPYWSGARDAAEAHARLRAADPAVADVIEAFAPWLLDRAEARDQVAAALAEVERLLSLR